jgi:hypothetical protein
VLLQLAGLATLQVARKGLYFASLNRENGDASKVVKNEFKVQSFHFNIFVTDHLYCLYCTGSNSEFMGGERSQIHRK